MKRIILLPLLLFLLPFFVIAQTTAKEWYDKGVSLKEKKDYQGALEAFKNAIDKKADYNDALYEAGWCCNELENYEDAIGFLKKYNPTDKEDKINKYNETAFSYYKLEKSAEAKDSYNNALAIDADNGMALRGMGNISYVLDEDHDKAIEFYEKAIKADEENSGPVLNNLGWLYNDKERYDDAIKVLQKAIEYDSEDAATREELGYAYYMKDEYEFAITQLNKAVELDEKSELGYFYKGLCFVATNKKGDAMSMYYKLKELGSDQVPKLLEKINAMK